MSWRGEVAHRKTKFYAGYFLFSFTLLLGMAEENPLWLVMLVVLNFGNSALAVKTSADK